jgi:hypothetical protein
MNTDKYQKRLTIGYVVFLGLIAIIGAILSRV